MPGDTITIPAGVYDVGDLSLPANVTLVASQGATIIGNLHISGPNTTVQGFTFAGGMVDIGNSQGATVSNNVFNGGGAGVKFDGADNAHILNNDFNNIAGGAVDGWGLNQSTVSGNHFTNVAQGINLNFNNDPTRGHDIVVEANQFTNTARMPIEVGPGGAYTSNLVIRDNWSDNSNLTNQAADGAVAYSIISTNGVNTLIEGNYAKGLTGPGIGVEMAGPGEIKNNMMDTYEFGIVVYDPGFNVHDNVNVNTPIAGVLNYSNAAGTMQNNTDQPDAALLAHVKAIDPPVAGATTDASQTVDPPASSAQADPTTDSTTANASQAIDPPASTAQAASTTGGATRDASHAIDPPASSAQAAPTADGTTSDASQAVESPASTAQPDPSADGTTSDTSPVHTVSPYIDMANPADADLVAIAQASGVQDLTLASVLSSDQGIGWHGVGSIADDTLANGTSILSQVEAIQAAGGHITISFGGEGGQEPALTAPSAEVLQSEYQSVIDRYHVSSVDFDIGGSAELDQHSITQRDQAIVGLQAANPDLKVSFTLPALSTGLDAGGLSVLQNAKEDGVHIDQVNIAVNDAGQSVDNNGQMNADAVTAAAATAKQLADLGLDAKVGITPMTGANDVASGVVKPADAQAPVSNPDPAQPSTDWAASDNGNSAGAHADAGHAHDGHVAWSDFSGIADHAFQYSGIVHHHDHVG
jgi:hypothetical protein